MADKDFFHNLAVSLARHPGTIGAIIVFLIGTVAGWVALQQDVAHVGRNVAEMRVMIERVNQDLRMEIKRLETEAMAGADRRNQRMEKLSNDVSEVKASIRGIDTAIQFLVRQQRQQERNNGGSVRQ